MRLYEMRIEINVFEIFRQPDKSLVVNAIERRQKVRWHRIRDAKLLSITIKASIKSDWLNLETHALHERQRWTWNVNEILEFPMSILVVDGVPDGRTDMED